ncbi:MAG: hypothetical protein Q9204_004417, partial [Flavoplaca sp. TL-2023a]
MHSLHSLPTTKPEAYVTQLDDGQVQVRYSAASTSGTTTTPFMFFNQASSGGSLSASSTASTLTSQTYTLQSTASEERPKIKSGAVDSGPASTDSTTARNSATGGATIPGSGDNGALSLSSNDQSLAEPRTTFSSSTIGATGASSQLQSNPLSETDAKTPLPAGTGSVTAGIHNSGVGIQSNKPGPEGHETSSMNNPLPSDSFTEPGSQTKPTERLVVGTSSGIPTSVVSTQSSASENSSPSGSQPPTPTSTTEASSTSLPPTRAEPSLLDRPADPTATPENGEVSTSNPTSSELPLPSLQIPASQGPQTTTNNPPVLSGDVLGLPTATWTTAPPDVKLQVMTNPAWSSDLLVTTALPGSNEPILAPVFANCDGCGPGGSLVVFGTFNPGISYNLPKIPGFPSVPRFHLPCIAFCPSPGGPSPGGTPPKPGPPKREDENGKTIEDNGGEQNDDKGNNKDDNNGDDKGGDKNDDKSDDKNDEENTNQDDQQSDEQEDDQNDEEKEEKDEDEQQSSSSQTAEPTSSTSATSSAPSSTESSTSSSTSSSTEISVITDTAYINVRPTDIFARDPEMEQYLLAAYSSLGIADDQVDSEPVPTATGLGITFFPESSMIPKPSSSSSSRSSAIPSSTSLPSTPSSSSSPPTPSPSEYKPDYNVEEINHGEMPDPLVCHGVGGDIWMIHRDQAVSAAEQFCEQEDEEKEYFQESVDHVKLRLRQIMDPFLKISDLDTETCISKFKTIIDSCDGDNPTHNPHNYKFG